LLGGGCSTVTGSSGRSVNKPGCPTPTEQGRSTKRAVVEEYLSGLQAGCEDQIWSLLSDQAELADGEGYLVGRAGLHRLVEAHCGLELGNVNVKYGKNTPYDPDPEMEPETTEYDHEIYVTAEFARKPGPHARYTQWLRAARTIERGEGKRTHNWYLEGDTVVKESHRIRRVPGESPCFHHELVGQVRDELGQSKYNEYRFVEVIPRDLAVNGDEAVLKVETWTRSSQDFSVARFEKSRGRWRLESVGPPTSHAAD
jgi:hypothetical protein